MKTETIYQDDSFYSKGWHSSVYHHRRVIMSAFMLFSDALTIATAILLSIAIWNRIRTDLQVASHLFMIPLAVLFFAFIYSLSALYPAIGIGPVEELKRLTIDTLVVGFALFALSFFLRNTAVYSRATLLISWISILIGAPLSRKVFRRLAVRLGLWGIPVMIVGRKSSVIYFQKHLGSHPLTGFWPVLCISGNVKDVFSSEGESRQLFSHIQTLIIVDQQGKFDAIRYLVTQTSLKFKHIIMLFDETKTGPIWFSPVTMVEHMGIEVVHNLLETTQKVSKRIMEIILIVVNIPVLIVLFIIIPLLIKITSPGPVFFKHRRIGIGGREIEIWKFRTMVYNAAPLLQEHLQTDPELQAEWENNFKFKNDPRVTPIGRILRRTSLDELPQIWNVIKGEMSLIGPRPIVEEEIPLYGDAFAIYKQVLPGITGLWQISGRNDLPYKDRVTLDIYYIQNWSIWFDIHILMHTILATLQARGAY